MTPVAALVRELVAAGLSGDDLVAAVERFERAVEPSLTSRQRANKRYYEANKASEKRLNASEKSESDTPSAPASPSNGFPTPLPITTSSPPPSSNSDAYASDAVGVVDARTALFRDGLARMERLTGKPASACRPILGRWLRDALDDARRVGRLIEDAEINRVADPVAWITRALKPKPPPLSEKENARKYWKDTLEKLGNYGTRSGCDHGAEAVRLLPAAGSGQSGSGSGGGGGVV